MSFNPNDNQSLIITRDNYEEYFLLYVDNELNEEERKAVEAFVQAHPDLRAELELLMTIKLPVEDKTLDNKQTLFADSMKLNAIDESILLYIDDELKGIEKENVEQKLENNKDFQLQHHLLLKTKLDRSEQIIYPYKEELYRKEKRRAAPIYWMRAAAIIIALGIGALVWTANNEPGKMDVVQGTGIEQPKNNNSDQKIIIPEQSPSQDNLAQTEVKDQKIKKEQHPVHSNELIAASKRIEKKMKTNNDLEKKEQIIEAPQVINNNIASKDPVQKEEDPVAKVDLSEKDPKQSFNDEAVTTSSDGSYNNQTATTAVLQDLAVDNEKKASLKGLLRKATRFIERRTNIKATNENDELLIGAVSIQL